MNIYWKFHHNRIVFMGFINVYTVKAKYRILTVWNVHISNVVYMFTLLCFLATDNETWDWYLFRQTNLTLFQGFVRIGSNFSFLMFFPLKNLAKLTFVTSNFYASNRDADMIYLCRNTKFAFPLNISNVHMNSQILFKLKLFSW